MKTGLVLLLAVMFVGTALSVEGWAESKVMARTPDDELPLMDLVFATTLRLFGWCCGHGHLHRFTAFHTTNEEHR